MFSSFSARSSRDKWKDGESALHNNRALKDNFNFLSECVVVVAQGVLLQN